MGCEGSKTSRVASPASIPGPPTGTLLEDEKKIVKPACYRWCSRSDPKAHPKMTASASRASCSSSSSTVDTLGENGSGPRIRVSDRGSDRTSDRTSDDDSPRSVDAFDVPDSPSHHNMPNVLRFPTRGASQGCEEDLNNGTSRLLEESDEAPDGKAAKANLPMDQYPWLEDSYSKVAPKLETSGVDGGHCEALDTYLLLGVSFCCVANLTQMRLDEYGNVAEVNGNKSPADAGPTYRTARKRLSWGP